MLQDYFYSIIKKLFSVPENKNPLTSKPGRILIVRQHNQLGDLLACVSIFRALKETYPGCRLTVIVSPANYMAVTKNKFIDELFVFDKKKILSPVYLIKLIRLLRREYDLAIVPVTVAISFTSNLLARLSNSASRIGVSSLNGAVNHYDFFFDRRVALNWTRYPDMNVSDFSLDIIRPFGISTSNMKTEITFDDKDILSARKFLEESGLSKNSTVIGLHIGAGKPPNRWPVQKFIELAGRLYGEYKSAFYLTGSPADSEILEYFKNHINLNIPVFFNKTIPEVAALVSLSDLFISNDTGIMHAAGATETPQVSLFGPTNPFNWAPIGSNKLFIRKSDFIDDITVEEVFDLCRKLLYEQRIENAG